MTARPEEFPGVDRHHRAGGHTHTPPTPIGRIVAAIVPKLPAGPITPAEIQRRTIERLEELDTELTALLATTAPRTWTTQRRALWRILRAARRELRATERTLTA